MMNTSEPGGLLLIDKQRGPTSADIVRSISRLIGKRNKIGHAGTLDPDATGLLVILVGGATRLSDHVMHLPKIYRAVIRFGVQTDTYDAMGTVVAEKDASGITEQDVAAILPRFTGNIMQKPPAYSAVKIAGKRAYDLARQGKLEDLPEREAVIHELKLESFNRPDGAGLPGRSVAGARDGAGATENPEVTVYVRCGKGTYLRTLAHDMGLVLGVGAHVKALRRLGIGSFEPTVNLTELTVENWREKLVNGAKIFEGQPVFELNARGALNLRRGIPVRATDFKERPTEPAGLLTGVLDEEGNLIAVAKIGIGGTLMDRKILQPL